MGKPRKFTPEFKAKVALAALKGDKPLAALCRELDCPPGDLLTHEPGPNEDPDEEF